MKLQKMSLHTYTGGMTEKRREKNSWRGKRGKEKGKRAVNTPVSRMSPIQKNSIGFWEGSVDTGGNEGAKQNKHESRGKASSGTRDHWQFCGETGFRAVPLCPNLPRPKIQTPNQHNTAVSECDAYVRNQYSNTREIHHAASSRFRTWAIKASCGMEAHFNAIKMLSVLTEALCSIMSQQAEEEPRGDAIFLTRFLKCMLSFKEAWWSMGKLSEISKTTGYGGGNKGWKHYIKT